MIRFDGGVIKFRRVDDDVFVNSRGCEVRLRGVEARLEFDDRKDNAGVGYSFCGPDDNFNKEYGRKIALERALEHFGLIREFRTVVWKAYHNRNKVVECVA